nr:hypothetical protein [Tanacetum cinerariifolium]
MASQSTMFNIKNLDKDGVLDHEGSKQVGFMQIEKLRLFLIVAMMLHWLKDSWRVNKHELLGKGAEQLHLVAKVGHTLGKVKYMMKRVQRERCWKEENKV